MVGYRILGPLEVADGDRVLSLGGTRQARLLAVLLTRANEVVSTDRLIDALWGERPPATAPKALQVAVSQLRKLIGEDALATRAPGYMLRVERGQLDANRFEDLLAQARRLLAGGEPEPARSSLDEALALWRGAPFAEFADEEFARGEIERLEELHLAAIEERFEGELALGRHGEAIAELERLAARHPLRERLHGQLMLAHYRCDRQADALDVYRRLRRRLVDELGLEPGPALQQLERAILTQDLSLAPPAPEVPRQPAAAPGLGQPARGGGRRLRWAVAAAALAVAGLVAVVLVQRGGGGAPAVVPNSLVRIDPRTNRIVDVVRVGRLPVVVTTTGDFVFVSNVGDGTLSRVDSRTGEVVTSGAVVGPFSHASDGESLWVGSFRREQVARLDPGTMSVADTLRTGSRSLFFATAGAGSVWATTGWNIVEPGYLYRLDAVSGAVQSVTEMSVPSDVVFFERAVWAVDASSARLLKIDARTNHLRARVEVGSVPIDVAAGFGSLWVTSSAAGKVWRIAPVTTKVEAIVTVGRGAMGIAVGARDVWVANRDDGTVSRIDPATSSVIATIRTGFMPHWVAVTDAAVWVSVAGRKVEDELFGPFGGLPSQTTPAASGG